MGLRIETGGMPRMIGSGSDSDPMIHHCCLIVQARFKLLLGDIINVTYINF